MSSIVPSSLSKNRNLPHANVRMMVSFGCFFYEFGVVAASGFCAVASTDEDEAFDVAAFN